MRVRGVSVVAKPRIPVMSPVLTASFLLVSGRQKASRRRLIGLALGLGGAAAYLVGANSAGGGSHRLVGDLLYVLSAVCWAAFTLSAPKVLAGVEPLTAMAYATCTVAVLLALVAAPDLGRVRWGALPSGVWLNVAYLAVGATAVANVFYYRGVAAVGPASASLMMFLVPAVNTVCATLFLGESFTAVQAVGAVVLLVGAALAGKARIRVRRRGVAAVLLPDALPAPNPGQQRPNPGQPPPPRHPAPS